jgi:hypothetical protein
MAVTMPIPEGFEALIRTGAWAAVLVAVLTTTWLLVMVLDPMPGGGSRAEVEVIGAAGWRQIPRFLPTTLVAFAYVPIWLALAVLLWREEPSLALPAAGFGLLYVPVTALGYWLQYTVTRALAEAAIDDSAGARAAYEVIGFHERRTSVTGAAVVLGYTLWSLGAVFAGAGLVRSCGSAAVATGVLLLVTAGLMVLGAAGVVIRNRVLELGVLLSGVASLAATIAAAVLLFSAE